MYDIIYHEDELLGLAIMEVNIKVNQLEKDGWIPQGGISISQGTESGVERFIVAQAMVKKDK